MLLEDSYKHKGMRRRMIAELRTMGISDEQVLDAMMKVPRHYFLSSAFLEYAYENKAFQIGAGQTISQPLTVAKQSQLLQVQKGDRILEIGTGSGFQTSVLCQMKAKVFSIERQKLLFDNAKRIIRLLGHSPRLSYGDGYKGWPQFAPFDGIIITCGAPYIPKPLLQQLKVGGRMIIPLGEGHKQEMHEIFRESETEFKQYTHGEFSFVPMLKNRQATR